MTEQFDRLICGDAVEALAALPDGCVRLIVTSPPYYQGPLEGYEAFLDGLDREWEQCARVLGPDGKLCINSSDMPVLKDVVPGKTRHVYRIPRDIDIRIERRLDSLGLEDLDTWYWQKQTSKLMMWPRSPGNVLSCETMEVIRVYRKVGDYPVPMDVRKANEFAQALRNDLTQKTWWIMPEQRDVGHPAPFPETLPARLIALYTFPGDVVLDPFMGSGTTGVAAKTMGRRWIGIDNNPMFIEIAAKRVAEATTPPVLEIGTHWRPRDPEESTPRARKSPEALKRKHETQAFGRSVTSAGLVTPDAAEGL